MATTTPNFGWAVPTSTDLVKDGAVAIETLGDSIDASLVDLKGGTTGQVLAKASGTDMDFSWTAIDPLVILDAKGDLITATAADTPARLAVGTNGQTLVADSTASTGLKWATPGATAQNFTLLSTTALTGAGTITISSLSGYNQLFIHVDGASTTAASPLYWLRLNTDTTSKYQYTSVTYNTTPAVYGFGLTNYNAATKFELCTGSSNTAGYTMMNINISGANANGVKPVNWTATGAPATAYPAQGAGSYSGTSVISSVSFICDSGTFDGGDVRIFGAA